MKNKILIISAVILYLVTVVALTYETYLNVSSKPDYTDIEIAESYAYDEYKDDLSKIELCCYDYATDILHFYIYRDGELVSEVGLKKQQWTDKLNSGYTYGL